MKAKNQKVNAFEAKARLSELLREAEAPTVTDKKFITDWVRITLR